MFCQRARDILQLQPLWDVLDTGEDSTTASFETRIYDLIPPNKVFSHYIGSLTTPPCTEVRAIASVARKQEMTIRQTSLLVSVVRAFLLLYSTEHFSFCIAEAYMRLMSLGAVCSMHPLLLFFPRTNTYEPARKTLVPTYASRPIAIVQTPQGVTWIVMNKPTTISKMQLDAFRKSVAMFPNSKVHCVMGRAAIS